MMHFENGFEFGINKRWDDQWNVWCEMNSASVGIEPTRAQPNEFPVHTILGVFRNQLIALDYCSRLANEFSNEFRRHTWLNEK